ncbi:MAG: PTS-dependent dihydroxyacetone kinase phosphotransferase subunit DhaM [Solobacterium sp.]|nr:PTS-dependent dihydroxyacetone kinase phosphotransferase subunit DhaM [Solobacterium sp.]
MVGIVLVSHSWKIAEGIRDLALQMAHDYKGLYCAAGLEDKSIGTDAVMIMNAIRDADQGDGVVVFADLGSGVISAEMAIDMLDDESIRVKLADAPIVEGAIVATVEASIGSSFERVLAEAEKARELHKA